MKNKGVSGSMEMKAFIFDMDGLIFDSERVVQRSWNIVGLSLIHILHLESAPNGMQFLT